MHSRPLALWTRLSRPPLRLNAARQVGVFEDQVVCPLLQRSGITFDHGPLNRVAKRWRTDDAEAPAAGCGLSAFNAGGQFHHLPAEESPAC